MRRLKFPDAGRVGTKQFLRGELAAAWDAYTEEEATAGWHGLTQPATIAALGGVLARLGGGKAKL